MKPTPFLSRTAATAWRACALLMLMLLAACAPDAPAPARTAASPAPTNAPTPRVRMWTAPAPLGAAQPDLLRTADGSVLISWVEPADNGDHRLRMARSDGQQAMPAWQDAITIAQGRDWFLNWADTPHVFALPDGSLWAHWLRSTGPARMDYGIDLVRSADGGRSWSQPQLVHPSGTPGDHGFVSFWPQARDQLGIAWLDSRQKAHDASGHGDDMHGHGSGAMMLRAAVYNADARQQGEWPLDASTCDCCTTSAAITDAGVVVVYRGRDAEEVRDTRLVRFDGQRWSAPRDVHRDGWHTAGCPVNGPVVVADGNTVWAAWYTEAAGEPELRAARSEDAGDHFAAPVTLAKGPAVLGRLSLALADQQLLAAWLEEADGGQRIVLGRYDRQWQQLQRIAVAPLAARGRASGMPRLVWSGQAAWLLWTDVSDGQPVLRGASVQ